MTVFACRSCGLALTVELRGVSFAELPPPPLPYDLDVALEDCPAWIKHGTFALDPAPLPSLDIHVPSITGPVVEHGPRRAVMVNPADLLALRLRPDGRNQAGCCGNDGCDGPNLVCGCGADVAVERSDCWTPRITYLDPRTVRRLEAAPPGVT